MSTAGRRRVEVGVSDDPCKPGKPPAKKPSGARFFSRAGIKNWAVQWWSTNGGSPWSTHEQGFAFLPSGDELIKGAKWLDTGTYAAQNFPCPGVWVSCWETGFVPAPVHLQLSAPHPRHGVER